MKAFIEKIRKNSIIVYLQFDCEFSVIVLGVSSCGFVLHSYIQD